VKLFYNEHRSQDQLFVIIMICYLRVKFMLLVTIWDKNVKIFQICHDNDQLWPNLVIFVVVTESVPQKFLCQDLRNPRTKFGTNLRTAKLRKCNLVHFLSLSLSLRFSTDWHLLYFGGQPISYFALKCTFTVSTVDNASAVSSISFAMFE